MLRYKVVRRTNTEKTLSMWVKELVFVVGLCVTWTKLFLKEEIGTFFAALLSKPVSFYTKALPNRPRGVTMLYQKLVLLSAPLVHLSRLGEANYPAIPLPQSDAAIGIESSVK